MKNKNDEEYSFFSMGVRPDEKIAIMIDGKYCGDVKLLVSNNHRRLAWKVPSRIRLVRQSKRNSRRQQPE
jgi:hypothetical protein